MYDSPALRTIWDIEPWPARASRPRPVTSELPQCARLLNNQYYDLLANKVTHHLLIHTRLDRDGLSGPSQQSTPSQHPIDPSIQIDGCHRRTGRFRGYECSDRARSGNLLVEERDP